MTKKKLLNEEEVSMLLATNIKDMNPEELFSIMGPIFYLVPLIIVIILAAIGVKIFQSLAVTRMLNYMERDGLNEEEKRNYLTNYLTHSTNSDLKKGLRQCPVCAKKYALKTKKTNSRGDMIEEWNYNGCKHCNTKVYEENEMNYKGCLAVKRTATASPKEAEWQKVFDKLTHYISYYKPYVDKTPDSSDGDNVTINITIR